MKSALAIQCLPKVEGDRFEVYKAVDKAIEVIQASGLAYTVCPFETVVEGPLEQLWELAQKAHQAVLDSGASGVSTYIKFFSDKNLGSTEEKLAKYRTQRVAV